MKIQLLKKTFKGRQYLMAVDSINEKKLSRIKEDKLFDYNQSIARYGNRHRQFFGILNFLFENLPEKVYTYNEKTKEMENPFPTVDLLKMYVLVKVGHCHIIESNSGVLKFPKSISYEKMPDERDFQSLVFRPALTLISKVMGYSSERELVEASYNWSKMQ